MIILDVNKLNKNFGFGALFENLSFSLNEGESISIVGPNGCGKSTLLKIIAGVEKADKGTISIKKDINIGYLDQTSADRKDSRFVKDVLLSTFDNLNQMKERIHKYEERLALEVDNEKLINQYCKLIEEFTAAGGYDVDVQINTVASGLGINKDILNREYTSLSGGEKTLVRLAQVLLLKPQLLLLDEPTNHLDIRRIEWLEDYIKSFKGATVIVSHDRYFLDKMSNKILDLTNLEPKVYNTNYSNYLKERELEFQKQMADYNDQQLVIKRFREQIKYFATRGMETNSSTMCDRAKVLQARLDRILANRIEKPQEDKKYKIEFSEEKKASKRVIETKNLCVTTREGKCILANVSLSVLSGERVALIGDNGSGKSTFIKTVLGLNNDLVVTGAVSVGDSTKIGYLPQIINFENENQTLYEYFKEQICANEEKTRRTLYSFGFDYEDSNKLVINLSGGERIRVRLAVLLEQNVNCLIFDEPTNHIDIQTKEMLEKSLEKFKGTFIFVSHDRFFINKFAEKTIEFKCGQIKVYNGNYEFYKRNKLIRKDI